MKNNTKEKGITLIALIVTIIVLLILAGVTIISLTGENGILGKSSDAKLKREIAKEVEQIKLSVNAVYTSYYDKGYLPVAPLRKELQNSYEGVTSVEETSDIGEATKVSKAKKKVDLGSMFWTESIAAENEDVEPTQEFAKVTYTSKREYYVKIKNVTGGNSDPVGTIYSKGGTTEDDVSDNSITYNLNGGTNPEDAPTSYRKGEVIGLPTPTKEGNAFEGWYQKSDFSDTRVLRTNDTMSGSITLYAKWTEETNPDYFTWADGSTTSTVTGFSEEGLAVYNAGNLTKLVIPKKHNNLNVTRISSSAFSQKDKLKQVIITENIVGLGDSTFYNCIEIEELTVPISVGVIVSGSNPAFRGCTNIKKFNFTKGTGEGESFSSYSYYNTPWYYSSSNNNTIEITMEEGITKIGNYAFNGCTGLQTLELPTTLTTVEENAFNSCSNWETNIDISKFTKIGNTAFYKCQKITGKIKWSEDLNVLGNGAFYECSGLTGNIVIPKGITAIGSNTFNGCSNITGELIVPKEITTIGNNAFCNCSGITKVNITEKTSLSAGSFHGCTGIEELTVPISTGIICDGRDPTFKGCTNIKKFNLTKGTGEGESYTLYSYYNTPWYYSSSNNDTIEIIMEEGITKIGDYAFNGCTGLQTLELPTTLTSIGPKAFYGCSNWKTEIDMSKWTTIGEFAFYNCENITGTFELSQNITQLGRYAFYNCSKLTGEVVIPPSITYVGDNTFYGCVGINKVVIPDTTTNLNSYVFYGCEGIEELTMPISTSAIADGSNPAFRGCTNIKKFNFTKGTGKGESFSNYSYYNTPWYYSNGNGIEVTMEEGITTIGSYTFYNCSGMRILKLPSTLTSIGGRAFTGCSSDLLHVFYRGSSSQWENIDFGEENRGYLSNVLYDQN